MNMEKESGIKKPLKEWLEEFYEDTSTISTLIRNIAFAGIGVIWIFKNTDPKATLLPKELIPPLFFLILGLISDIAQYLWRAINIYIFYKIKDVGYVSGRLKEKDISDVTMPNYILAGTWTFFFVKIGMICIAYYKIFFFLTEKM
jgi:hypothetical protein